MKFEEKKAGWNLRAYTIATLIFSVVVCLFVVGNLVLNLSVNVETTDTEEEGDAANPRFEIQRIEGHGGWAIVNDGYTGQSYIFKYGTGGVWLRPTKEELYR